MFPPPVHRCRPESSIPETFSWRPPRPALELLADLPFECRARFLRALRDVGGAKDWGVEPAGGGLFAFTYASSVEFVCPSIYEPNLPAWLMAFVPGPGDGTPAREAKFAAFRFLFKRAQGKCTCVISGREQACVTLLVHLRSSICTQWRSAACPCPFATGHVLALGGCHSSFAV